MLANGRDLRICFVSTYPPRECGIATFTYDLREAFCRLRPGAEATVFAMANGAQVYPSEVVFEIRQNQLGDYRLAAEYANLSGVDVVCLQHEFGVFGGAEGRYIIEMLDKLRKPVVTTLHTVLREPAPGYRETLMNVAQASVQLVVMNPLAVPILKEVYGIPEEKLRIIHHGVPDVPFVDPNYYKDKLDVEGRFVILTFGLLSRNKGIEMVLRALPEVVRRHPEVVYVVLGATHPEVKKHEGEEYRLWLQRLVRDLALEEHVIFYDRYVDLSELLELIGACDVYVTPYRSREQITSGTLAYAVGMGKAVISTPYPYARELLADGRGGLVDYEDSPGLARAILNLVEKPALLHRMRKSAYEYGRSMVWTEVAARYAELFDRVVAAGARPARPARRRSGMLTQIPEIKLDHLMRLTDDTGIMQHATYGVPDRRFGYTTDDAARALVVVMAHHRQFGDGAALDLAHRYLSFLQYAQQPDGRFRNLMNYARQFVDEQESEDTLGRALWGLGAVVAGAPAEPLRALAREMFERAAPRAAALQHPRAIAYAICGMFHFLQRYPGAALMRRRLLDLAEQLAGIYERSSRDDWRCFGDESTYANARMPQAMLLAYGISGEERHRRIGLEALDFLISLTYRDGHFDFIGNQGWYRRGGERAQMSQQPIEAGYTAEACLTAYQLTGEQRYLDLAQAAAEWLLGRNRLGARLYDFTSGACSDGLDPQGPSVNQGAEAAICGLLALLTVSAQQEEARHGSAAATARGSGDPASLPVAV